MSAKSLPPEQQTLLDQAKNLSKKRFEEQERDTSTVIFAGSKGGVSYFFLIFAKVHTNTHYRGNQPL
jgi:hypothetical protein